MVNLTAFTEMLLYVDSPIPQRAGALSKLRYPATGKEDLMGGSHCLAIIFEAVDFAGKWPHDQSADAT